MSFLSRFRFFSFYSVLVSVLTMGASQAEVTRIAVLPPMLNQVQTNPQRFSEVELIHSFTQLELLKNYRVVLTDRSTVGASAAFATLSIDLSYEAVPANYLILPVYDAVANRLTLHPYHFQSQSLQGKYKRLSPVRLPLAETGKVRASEVGRAAAEKIADAFSLRARQAAAEEKRAIHRPLKLSVELVGTTSRTFTASEESQFGKWLFDNDLAGLTEFQGMLKLTDRQSIASSLDEAKLRLMTSNAEARAPVVDADLVLSVVPLPGIDLKEDYLLFATHPATSTFLAAAQRSNFQGEGDMVSFIKNSLRAQLDSRRPMDSDFQVVRRAESDLYLSLADSFLGYRMTKEAKSAMKLNLYQAALGLVVDDPGEWRKTLYEVMAELFTVPLFPAQAEMSPNSKDWKKTDPASYQRFQKSFGEHMRFHLVRLESEQDGGEDRVRALLRGACTSGDWEKVENLSDGLNPALRQKLIYYPFVAQLQQEQYGPALDVYSEIEKPWFTVAWFKSFALRERGSHKEAYDLLQKYENNGVVKSKDIDMIAWYLREQAERVGAGRMINTWSKVHSWRRDEAPLILALASVMEKEKQRDRLSSILTAAALRLKDKRSSLYEFPKERAALAEMIKAHGAKADPSKYWIPAKDRILRGKSIQVIIDSDYDANSDTAAALQEVADFWGCPVEVHQDAFRASELKAYDPVKETVDQEMFLKLANEILPKEEETIEQLFLIPHKLVSKRGKSVGDIYRAYGNGYSVASTYYVKQFHLQGQKDEVKALSVLMGNVSTTSRYVSKNQLPITKSRVSLGSRLQPDLGSGNGHLHFFDHHLFLSPITKEVFENHSPEHFDEYLVQINKWREEASVELDKEEERWASRVSRQIKSGRPIILNPR